MSFLRKDCDNVEIYQWQRQVGEKWSSFDLPCSGDGYSKRLYPEKWEQIASGACWQLYGIYGFLSKEAAISCFDLVEKFLANDGKYNTYRLAKITVSQSTKEVLRGIAEQ